MLCICALYSKRQQIKFFEKIFDRCARSLEVFILMRPWPDFLFWKSRFVQESTYQGNLSRNWKWFPGRNWKDMDLPVLEFLPSRFFHLLSSCKNRGRSCIRWYILRIHYSWFYYTSIFWKSVDAERRLLFKHKRLRSRRKLLKAVWAKFGRWSFRVEDHNVVRRRRTWKKDFILEDETRKKQSCFKLKVAKRP